VHQAEAEMPNDKLRATRGGGRRPERALRTFSSVRRWPNARCPKWG
jgi:hypothetical protein